MIVGTLAERADSVTSRDGTRIAFRALGAGPGLLVLHGSVRASHHYLPLAAALADAFTVYLPDRRGRGGSGPWRGGNAFEQECDDVAALLERTGARFVFGHSAGGVLALESARIRPPDRLAVYEPPISLGGSIPTAWLAGFEAAMERGDAVAALSCYLAGVRIHPIWRLPDWLRGMVLQLAVRSDEGRETAALLPTLVPDFREVQRLDSSIERYARIATETLLLGGSASPPWFREALAALRRTLPWSRQVELRGLGHNAPNASAPGAVAAELRTFFGS